MYISIYTLIYFAFFLSTGCTKRKWIFQSSNTGIKAGELQTGTASNFSVTEWSQKWVVVVWRDDIENQELYCPWKSRGTFGVGLHWASFSGCCISVPTFFYHVDLQPCALSSACCVPGQWRLHRIPSKAQSAAFCCCSSAWLTRQILVFAAALLLTHLWSLVGISGCPKRGASASVSTARSWMH